MSDWGTMHRTSDFTVDPDELYREAARLTPIDLEPVDWAREAEVWGEETLQWAESVEPEPHPDV